MSDFDLLVVDDEPVVVEAARRVLEPEGFTIDGAGEGRAAIDKLRRHHHGLILLDLMLPGVSGLELLDALVTEYPSTPVIVTTGYASSRKSVEVLKAGAFDFLPKPFDVEELLGVVRRGSRFGAAGSTVETLGDRRSRFLRERETSGVEGAIYLLGAHSWASPDQGDSVTLGVAETFPGALGDSPRFRLAEVGSEIVQGRSFARIESTGPCVHRVWAPLGGRIVGCNPRLEVDPGLVERSPLGRGWLIRISPTNLREELDELTLG